MDSLGWMDEGACKAEGALTPLFFDSSPMAEARAKACCARCCVSQECLKYALETGQEFGVWGGLNERERTSRLYAGIPSRPLDFEMVTYTTRARSTGATCSAGRAGDQWGAHCETHGNFATTTNRTAAEYAVSRPQEWCPDCGVAFLEKVG